LPFQRPIGRSVVIERDKTMRAFRGARAARPKEDDMMVRRATAAAGLALGLAGGAAQGGPCTDRIYETDLLVSKLLDAAAARGRSGSESAFATMHRQPTPGSIASAEEQAGDLSAEDVDAVTEAMDVARHADDAGDRAGCEKALGEVDSILDRGPSP
jgi:hypothetical protein